MTKFHFTTALAAAFIVATPAAADVVVIGTQDEFTATGTIVQNTNFDDNGANFTTPGSPYVVGGLTFIAGGQNLIGGRNGYGFTRSLFTDNNIRGTTINIGTGAINMFAFNLGNFFSTGAATLRLTTNLGTYNFTPTINSAVNGGGLTFQGFRAGPGEHFTSVAVSGSNATGFTDIQLGMAGAVPEPATWAMMILGFGVIGGAMRSRRRQTVRFATA